MTLMRDAALRYAAMNWACFPVYGIDDGQCSCPKGKECDRAGKHPIPRHGCKDATTDTKRLEPWFTNYPTANIGIATGEVSDFFVVDVDGEQGKADLAALEKQHGQLPTTVKSQTGSGGFHLFFKLPQGVQIKNGVKLQGTKIDTRSTAGYIVAPPSNHASGNRYEWVNDPAETPIAEAPEWLVRFVTKGGSPAESDDAVFQQITGAADLQIAPGVSEGGRHDMACKLIGAALARGRDPFTVLHQALEWNKRNSPPLPVEEIIRIGADLSKKDAEKLDDEPAAEEAPWPVLGESALHGLAGEIVRAIEPHTEADPAAILIQLLVFFGCVIGRSAHFVVEATRHFGNLFVVLVGETAKGRKGTSADRIRELFRWVEEQWLSRVTSGLSSGEGLIWVIRDPIEKREAIKEKGRVVDYQTVIDDHGEADKRLLVIESEYASILRIAKRDGNTLSQVLRDAWDSGNLRTMTKNSPARATNGHIALLGHITREELLSSLAEVEAFNGFANRFLWVAVKRSKLLPDGGGAVDLTPFIDRLTKAVDFAKGVGQMARNPAAGELWAAIYKELDRRRLGGRLGAVTNRAEAQVLRLSILYALLDTSATIEPRHLEAAKALWQYAEDSARWTFGCSTGDALADRLLALIRQKPLTMKEIHNITNRHFSAEKLRQALHTLARMKLVRCSKDKDTGGRPAERWHPAE